MVTPISGVSPSAASNPIGRIIQPVSHGDQSGPGFADRIQGALEGVSRAEHDADLKVQDVAAGGDTPIHELLVSNTKAQLSVELLVQTRNKAVEAYQEIMRMQV